MRNVTLIIAVVLFVFAAFGASLPMGAALVPLGLAFFAASQLV